LTEYLQSEEISYVYQRLGYKYLSETSFEDAGINLFRGNVDPRLLVRLFPALRGTLLSSSISLPVFYGLESQLRSLNSVDTISELLSPHSLPVATRSVPLTSPALRSPSLYWLRELTCSRDEPS
jgi:vacuolar protein sorting-associated protein 3